MEDAEIIALAKTSNRSTADELRRLLDEKGISSLLLSDDPAESVMNTYFGASFQSNYTIHINKTDLSLSREILNENGYGEYMVE